MFLEDVDLLFEVLDVEGAEALMANSWIVTRGIRIEGWVMMVVVMMVVVVMVLTIKTLRKMRVMVPMTIVLTWVGGVVVVVVVAAAAAVVGVVGGTGDGLFVRPAMPTVCGVALHSTWGRDPGTPRLLW